MTAAEVVADLERRRDNELYDRGRRDLHNDILRALDAELMGAEEHGTYSDVLGWMKAIEVVKEYAPTSRRR